MPDHEHDRHWDDRMDVQEIAEHLEQAHGWVPEGLHINTGVLRPEHRRRHAAMTAGQDGLAKVLAFRFAVPAVGSEAEWDWLSDRQRQQWRLEADMVRGYLENAEGWRRP
jgi:hypothetical protein